VNGALGEKKRESFEGEAVSRHDEIEAERLLRAGIRALALAGINEVKRLRKNDKRKQALVWLVKSRTVAGHEWILDRLEIGHRSNVTRAMAGFRNLGDRETRGLKAKMIKCSDLHPTDYSILWAPSCFPTICSAGCDRLCGPPACGNGVEAGLMPMGVWAD